MHEVKGVVKTFFDPVLAWRLGGGEKFAVAGAVDRHERDGVNAVHGVSVSLH